jgi:hypothetical protein
VLIAVVVVVAVLFAVGTAGQVRTASKPYHRSIDRSYAAMAAPLGRHSAATGAELRRTLDQAAGLPRVVLFQQLDGAVADAAQSSARFASIAPPDPQGDAGASCSAAIEARAAGTDRVRNAVEGLLGGRDGGAGISQPATVQALARAGAQLASSDAAWASCRRRLATAPGSARLPRSVWVTDPGSWAVSSLTPFVAALASSPSLAVRHDLAIGADSLTLVPGSVSSSLGAAVLPPTHSVTVRIVVQNGGNVDERDVIAHLVVTPASPSPSSASAGAATGPRASARSVGTVAAGASTAVSPPPVRVVPGVRYTVTVSVTSAASGGTPATRAIPVAIAPQASSTSLTSSGSPSRTGHRVVYSAVVSAAGTAATPTGTITFVDGTLPIPGCLGLTLSQGQATCTVRYTTPGVRDITATYTGTPQLAGSTSALLFQAVQGPTLPSAPSSTTTTVHRG